MQRTPIIVGSDVIHIRTLADNAKPPILLVHGLGVSGDYYVKYAEALAPFFSVHIIDLPGYGKTPKPRYPLTINQLSNIVVQYVAQSKIQKCIIVGQSMGAQIAAHAINDSPNLFTRALLLAPTTNKDERTVPMQAFRLWQDTFHEKMSINFIVFTNYVRMGLRRFLITSRFMVSDHLEVTLKTVILPVLVVSGSKDKIAPKKWANYLAQSSSYVSTVEIQSAPHLLQYDTPEELVQITREFTNI